MPTNTREVIEMSTAQDRPGLHGGALVVWSGDLKSGTGRLRFEYGAGGELALLWPGSAGYRPGATTPEELTAAAHAACFTMTLAHTLARNGHSTSKITAAARATFGIADHV
jgi:osmotically inducible protein OsmC